MSNIHKFPAKNNVQTNEDDLCLTEACDWLAKIERGLSSAEKKSLQLWFSQSSQNTKVLLEVAQLWDKMEAISRLSDLFPQASTQAFKNKPWYGAVAASLVLAIGLGMYQTNLLPKIFSPTSTVVASQTNYQTDIGQSNTINLPDNSKIMLNTNSFVQVKYTDKARIIELQRGEIHVDVAHDKTRPLSVIAAGKVIQAVGTAFNVEMKDGNVELIVTDGKVLVAQVNNTKKDNKKETVVKKLPNTAMAIVKGEKVKLASQGDLPTTARKIDEGEMVASLSWRQGNIVFRGESLAQAMLEISRYTDIEFILHDDPKLKNQKVAGVFKTGDVTGLLEVLNRNFNITSQRRANKTIFLQYAG